MLNRKLRWALGATLLLTAGALLMPERDEPPRIAANGPSDQGATSTAAHEAPGTALPGEIERQTFSVPERDPFADPTPPPAPVAPPAVISPVGPPLPPPAPPPPPFRAGYAAQLRTPTGERVLYLRDGEQLVAARVGAVLSGGYVIERLESSSGGAGAEVVAVEVVHPPSGSRQVIPIPDLNQAPQQ